MELTRVVSDWPPEGGLGAHTEPVWISPAMIGYVQPILDPQDEARARVFVGVYGDELRVTEDYTTIIRRLQETTR